MSDASIVLLSGILAGGFAVIGTVTVGTNSPGWVHWAGGAWGKERVHRYQSKGCIFTAF